MVRVFSMWSECLVCGQSVEYVVRVSCYMVRVLSMWLEWLVCGQSVMLHGQSVMLHG